MSEELNTFRCKMDLICRKCPTLTMLIARFLVNLESWGTSTTMVALSIVKFIMLYVDTEGHFDINDDNVLEARVNFVPYTMSIMTWRIHFESIFVKIFPTPDIFGNIIYIYLKRIFYNDKELETLTEKLPYRTFLECWPCSAHFKDLWRILGNTWDTEAQRAARRHKSTHQGLVLPNPRYAQIDTRAIRPMLKKYYLPN